MSTDKQLIVHKTKDWTTRTPHKLGMLLVAPEGSADPEYNSAFFFKVSCVVVCTVN